MAKTKTLISFAVTAKLICVFVFACAKIRFSHNAAPLLTANSSWKSGLKYECCPGNCCSQSTQSMYSLHIVHWVTYSNINAKKNSKKRRLTRPITLVIINASGFYYFWKPIPYFLSLKKVFYKKKSTNISEFTSRFQMSSR